MKHYGLKFCTMISSTFPGNVVRNPEEYFEGLALPVNLKEVSDVDYSFFQILEEAIKLLKFEFPGKWVQHGLIGDRGTAIVSISNSDNTDTYIFFWVTDENGNWIKEGIYDDENLEFLKHNFYL